MFKFIDKLDKEVKVIIVIGLILVLSFGGYMVKVQYDEYKCNLYNKSGKKYVGDLCRYILDGFPTDNEDPAIKTDAERRDEEFKRQLIDDAIRLDKEGY